MFLIGYSRTGYQGGRSQHGKTALVLLDFAPPGSNPVGTLASAPSRRGQARYAPGDQWRLGNKRRICPPRDTIFRARILIFDNTAGQTSRSGGRLPVGKENLHLR